MQLWLFSGAVLAPATKVNAMLFCRLTLGAPTGAIVAVPVQLPANADGIVRPVTGTDEDGELLAGAGSDLLARLAVEPARLSAALDELGDDPRVNSRTPPTMSAATMTAPQTARTAPRRDRSGLGRDDGVGSYPAPGQDSSVGSGPDRGIGPVGGAGSAGGAGGRRTEGSTRRSSRSRALGRRAGSLFRHSLTTGRNESGKPLTSGSSYKMRCMTAGTVSASKAGRPVAAKIIVPPHAKTSTALVGRSPASCSGVT